MNDPTARGGAVDVTVVVIVPVAIRGGRRGGITAYSVPCGSCDQMIVVAARTYRDLRRTNRLPVCDTCRRPASIMVTEQHVRYWQDRFSEREIRFMGSSIASYAENLFGTRGPLPVTPAAREQLALAASATPPRLTA